MTRILLFIFLLMTIVTPSRAEIVDFNVYVGKVSPFVIVSNSGTVSGAAVDVVDTIMKRAGNPIRKDDIQTITWARALDDTENKYGTMLFCVAKTYQRSKKFKWVGPIADLNLGLVAKRESNIQIRKKSELKDYRIGVVRNSAPIHILEGSYGISPSNLTLLSGDELQFRMLEQGRVDLITQADTAAPAWLEALGMHQADFEMVHVMKHLNLYIAFNKETDQALIDRIQAALDDLKKSHGKNPSEYEMIMRKYLKDGPIAVQQTQ